MDYDKWKTTTPEDEWDQEDAEQARINKRLGILIDEMESGDYPDAYEGPWA